MDEFMCAKCHGSAFLDEVDEEPSHGMCWPCASDALESALARIARLRQAVTSAIDHLVAEGPCGAIDDDEAHHCGRPECTYCALNRAVSALSYDDLHEEENDG